jgi:hypothetical protein
MLWLIELSGKEELYAESVWVEKEKKKKEGSEEGVYRHEESSPAPTSSASATCFANSSRNGARPCPLGTSQGELLVRKRTTTMAEWCMRAASV